MLPLKHTQPSVRSWEAFMCWLMKVWMRHQRTHTHITESPVILWVEQSADQGCGLSLYIPPSLSPYSCCFQPSSRSLLSFCSSFWFWPLQVWPWLHDLNQDRHRGLLVKNMTQCNAASPIPGWWLYEVKGGIILFTSLLLRQRDCLIRPWSV